ncbi:MAG: radical SAM protein [Desulfobacterales bacterium]|nr:radical SAM protein [Desulfobacterales bacterium]
MSKIKKLLLIAPPSDVIYGTYKALYRKGFLNPPIHLCYVAASAEAAGHKATILDGDAERLTISDIIQTIKQCSPHLIGITSTSIDFWVAAEIIIQIKTIFPYIPVILGGIHINIFGIKVLEKHYAIDFGCVGDGEHLIVELLDKLEDGIPAYSSIKGLIYRDGDQVIQNPYREINRNLDCYPFPSRHLLKNELYYRSVPYRGYQQTTAVMSSRGCPFRCVYCAVEKITGGKQVRIRSAQNVLEELTFIVKKLHIQHVAFNDDCLTLDKSRIVELCEGILQRNLQFTWEGLSRADLVDSHILKKMKQAGLVRISYGIESGNPNILKTLRKEETLDQITEAFRITKEAGIVTRGSIILGVPYENRKTIKQTLDFVNHLKGLDQLVVNVLQPYPGTKVREMILNGEGGACYLGDTDSFYSLQRFGSSSVSVNDLSPRDLVFFQKWGFLSFYFRPKIFLNNLRISGYKAFIQDGIGFMRSILGI